MSDEIEIEEHDLLDDPTVRNIFPDISILKQEILDYEDTAPEFGNPVPKSTEPDSDYDNLNCAESSANGADTKVVLPDDFIHNLQNDGSQNNGFIRREKGIAMKICNNKIILGSKPVHHVDSKEDHFEKHIKPYCAVVALEDFGVYLNTSLRYCKHCQTLFPTNLDFKNHEKYYHNELVNNSDCLDEIRIEHCNGDKIIANKNKAIESKSNCNNEDVQQKTKKMLKKVDEEISICLICNAHLKYKRNLKVHLMQVHKISKDKLAEMIHDKKPGPREDLTSEGKRNECFHCKKTFRSQNLLIEHIYSILQNPKSGSDKYSNKILIGNKTNNERSATMLHSRNSNLVDVPDKTKSNENVGDCSETRSISKDVNTQNLTRYFKCRFCLLYFKTTKYFFRHMKNKHKLVSNFQTTKILFDPKCKHCSKINDDVDSYNRHIRKSHPKKVKEAIAISRKSLVSRINKGEMNIISKENFAQNGFYRCDFCCLYFNNLTFFIRHVTIKHKVTKMPKPNKVPFDSKCKYCAGTYPNVKRYNVHLNRIHSAICNKVVERLTLNSCDEKGSTMVSNANISKTYINSEVYRCKFCPVYFKTTKWFIRHLNSKHKIVTIPKLETEQFDPKCKYCPKELRTVTMYNDHLYKSHSALLNKVLVKSPPAKVIANNIKINLKPKSSMVNNSYKGETSKDISGQTQIYIEGYRCQFCPMFFKSMRFCAQHVKMKHKPGVIPKPKKVKFDLRCKYCSTKTKSIQSYNRHIYKIHNTKKANNENKDSRKDTEMLHNTKTAVDIKRKKFYRCGYCSHYFNHLNIYNSHLKRKHKVQRTHDIKKIEFDPHCKYCPLDSVNEIAYNKHLYKYHKNRVNEIFTGRSKDKIHQKKTGLSNNAASSSVKKCINKSSQNAPKSIDKNNKIIGFNSNMIPILKSALFKCHKCDIHFLTIKTALDHTNHMELLVNWKCSLCNRIFKDNDKWLHERQHMLSHVFTVYDLNTANTSHILYKCYKCDLHYDESVDDHHKQCVLKIPQSYTCEICKIAIDCNAKICHEYNHKHKHLTSNDFIVIETDVIFDGNAGIRSDENNTQIMNKEYSQDKNGDNKQKNNLKRKINNTENEVQFQHNKVRKTYDASCFKNKLKDTVSKEIESNATTLNQQRFDKMSLKLSFCSTCKSFVSIIGQKRKEHAQGLCGNLPTLVCKDCGLRFSCKTLSTHRQVHLRIKKLELQNFKFYAFNTGKRAMPPMPEYEKCEICDVNFISKSTLGQHVCSDNEYKMCEICKIKLFTPVFHLHMAFHKYTIDDTSSNSMTNNAVVCEKVEEINETNVNIPLILYCCKDCNIFMDTYDRLIDHCQRHCLDTLLKYTEECKICNLKFVDESMKSHGKVHEKLGVPSFKKLFFDPYYFRFENKVWLNHVFGSNPTIIVQDVILSSCYRNEHRFKMHVVQEGRSELTLYKCDKCNRYVEPDIIYHHIENSCSNLRKYPCPICHLDFISSFSLTRHKITHEDPKVTLKSYRIVHFNRQGDAALNAVIFSPPKLYVLYQCRHCNGIVDSLHRMSHLCDENGLKSCLYCGLLITNEVYEQHISKHKTLDSFISENIKVILFGEYELHNKKFDVTPISTFRGKIHDYTFYKCRNCYVCVKHKKSTQTHTCCFKGARMACSKCGLYFNTDKLISHTKGHETDPDFILDNMNIIEFNPTKYKPKADELKLDDNKECADVSDCIDVNENLNKANQGTDVPRENSLPCHTETKETPEGEKIADIYKCSCGLHFIDEVSITEHIIQCGSKAKQAKQNCSKCGLLFTPNVLFKHLLTHHGDKLINFKFNIVEKCSIQKEL